MLATALLALLVPQGPSFADYPKQDALSYDLKLQVDMADQRLKGDVRYRFRADDVLQGVVLDARHGDDWKVTFSDDDGTPLPVRWHDDNVIIELGRSIEPGAEFAFRAHIEGKPIDGFYFADNRYGEPMAFTDHYSIRARGWLPCEDNPADRATFHLQLDYPAGLQVVASGRPDGDLPLPPEGRGIWRSETVSDIPPYMFAVVIGPFARVPEAGDPRLGPHLIYHRDEERAKAALVHDAQWLKIMETTFGPYPYAKYTLVQCPTRWGGFEAPGNVQLSERIFDQPGAGTSTMAHELTHMWFGDGVGYERWSEVWLAEGFASYFGPWLCAQTGGPPLADRMAAMREDWRRSREGRTKSVRWTGFTNPDQALNRNTYPKGAWVLHMLRGELGDELFFAALREYYNDNRGTSVRTAALALAIRKATGRDMSWFLEQWLNRIGCPRLAVRPYRDTIIVEQTHPGAPYRFRLRLRWKNAGDETHEEVFEIRHHRTDLPIANGPAHDLEVDPDCELLYREDEQ